MDWNTFQYIDVIAQTGSLTAAAKILGLNQSTLSRHLQKFEQEHGARLFKRSGNKYETTDIGLAYVQRAQQMRQAVEGVNVKPSVLTVTSLDSFFSYFLLRHVSAFPHPIHFISGNSNFDLSRREADIAIRFGKPQKGDYVIKKIGRMACAVYSQKRLQREGTLASRRWAVMNDTFSQTADARWLAGQDFEPMVEYTTTSYPQIMALLESSDCLGILPCMMGDESPSLRRFASASPIFYREIWLIIHRNLHDAKLIRDFKLFLETTVAKNVAKLEG